MNKTDYVRTEMKIYEFNEADVIAASDEFLLPASPDAYEGAGY